MNHRYRSHARDAFLSVKMDILCDEGHTLAAAHLATALGTCLIIGSSLLHWLLPAQFSLFMFYVVPAQCECNMGQARDECYRRPEYL